MQFSETLVKRTKAYFEKQEGHLFSDAEIEGYLQTLASYGRLLVKIRLEAEERAAARPGAGLRGPVTDEVSRSTLPAKNHGASRDMLGACESGCWGTGLVTQYPRSATDTPSNENNKAGRDG